MGCIHIAVYGTFILLRSVMLSPPYAVVQTVNQLFTKKFALHGLNAVTIP